MGISFNIGALILAVILVGVAYIAYRGTTPSISTGRRVVLTALRVTAFLLLVLLLMDPRYVFDINKTDDPLVIALIDRSASMSLPVIGFSESGAPARFDRGRQYSEELRRAVLSRGGEFREHFFSVDLMDGAADSARADGQGTDIIAALESMYKQSEGENVAAFVVFSDGVETEERLVQRGVPELPVFTVGLGDTSSPEDVRIADVDYNSVVRAPSRSSILATVRYSGGTTRRVRLELTENNRRVFAHDTVLSPQVREFVQEIPIEFNEPGRRRFELVAQVDGEDVEIENNRREIVIEAEKAGVRILIVDLLPEWELHFLTEFLRSDETFDFDLVSLVGNHPSITNGRIKSPDNFLDDLDDYDTVILASVNSGFIDARVSRALKSFVREKGKGLLILPGPSSIFEHRAAWSGVEDLLPVRGRAPHRFNLQFTSVRPGAQAATNPITAQLVPLFSQGDWQQRSPLLGFYAPLVPKNNVEVLLETDGRRSPAFIYQNVGKGRVALLSAGPIWRWKFLDEGNTLYDEMMSRMLDVLSRGEETERFVLMSKKNVYDSGEAPMFTAEIFNEKMQPVTGAPVRIEVIRIEEDGTEVPLQITAMRRDGADNPRFRTTLPPLGPGRYRVQGQADLTGRTLSSAPVDIMVSEISVEFQNVAQDRSHLITIAARSGGRYTNGGDMGALVSRMQLQPRVSSVTTEMSLRTSAIVFSLILLILAVEWLIRKRTGMI